MSGTMTITHRRPDGSERTAGPIDQDTAPAALRDIRERAEKPRNDPPTGSMAVRSGEVERVVCDLIERFPDTFGHLDQWSRACAEDANPPKKGCKARARTIIVPPIYQQLYGDDLLVVVSEKWWADADATERRAGVYHALCHVWTATEPDTGEPIGLRTSNHQVEAFFDEVAHFGAWDVGIRETANQLRMFEDSAS
jgi:hypothetical protein